MCLKKTNAMEVISVIIPIYNSDKHLQKLLNSVINQSYRNIEIILVDDGSTDKSYEIIDQYAVKDDRVTAIHQINAGVSKARNVGLEKASGQWIYFLDSDDWIEADYLLNFIKESEDYDMIIQGFTKDNQDTGITENVQFKATQYLKNYEVIEMLQHKKNVHNGYLWHRLFRRSIINENHLRFVEGCNFAEDGVFFLQYMKYVKKTNILETSGHHYVIHNASLSNKKYQKDFYLSVAGIYNKALTEIKGDSRYRFFCRNYIWQLVFYWIICQSLHVEDGQLKENLCSVLNFLRSRNIRKPFVAISILKFISSIDSSTTKQKLLALFVWLEKKHINISKYLKSVVNE